MEPARKLETWSVRERPVYDEPETEELGDPEWKIKLGKMLFYITLALSVWFFYWLNGIQCPCE